MKTDAVRFEVRFDGPALANGTMDVRDLAPALLAVAGTLQSANRLLNGDDSQLQVRVRSDFQRGSFGVDLETSQSIFQALRVLVQSEGYKSAKEILELLFGSKLVQAGLVGGVVLLYRLLHGKKPETQRRLPDGNVELTIGNTTYTVNGDVYNIYCNGETRVELAKMVAPLGREGIDSITVTTPSEESPARIDKTDLPYFAEDAPPSDGTPFEGQNDRLLAVVKVVFKDRNKWTFTDGSTTINATIKDDEFMARVHRRDLVFGEGDLLSVRLAWKATQGERGLQTAYEVLKVHDIFPRGTQASLPFAESEPNEDESDDES